MSFMVFLGNYVIWFSHAETQNGANANWNCTKIHVLCALNRQTQNIYMYPMLNLSWIIAPLDPFTNMCQWHRCAMAQNDTEFRYLYIDSNGPSNRVFWKGKLELAMIECRVKKDNNYLGKSVGPKSLISWRLENCWIPKYPPSRRKYWRAMLLVHDIEMMWWSWSAIYLSRTLDCTLSFVRSRFTNSHYSWMLEPLMHSRSCEISWFNSEYNSCMTYNISWKWSNFVCI